MAVQLNQPFELTTGTDGTHAVPPPLEVLGGTDRLMAAAVFASYDPEKPSAAANGVTIDGVAMTLGARAVNTDYDVGVACEFWYALEADGIGSVNGAMVVDWAIPQVVGSFVAHSVWAGVNQASPLAGTVSTDLHTTASGSYPLGTLTTVADGAAFYTLMSYERANENAVVTGIPLVISEVIQPYTAVDPNSQIVYAAGLAIPTTVDADLDLSLQRNQDETFAFLAIAYNPAVPVFAGTFTKWRPTLVLSDKTLPFRGPSLFGPVTGSDTLRINGALLAGNVPDLVEVLLTGPDGAEVRTVAQPTANLGDYITILTYPAPGLYSLRVNLFDAANLTSQVRSVIRAVP